MKTYFIYPGWNATILIDNINTYDSSGSTKQTLKTKTSSIETHKMNSTILDFDVIEKIGKS